MNRILSALAVAAVAAFALPAHAGSGTASFTVQASVANNCTISAANMTFAPAYDPVVANAVGGADLTAQADLTIACTVGWAPTVTLDDGIHGVRAMANGAAPVKLNYELYSDAGRTARWGSSGSEIVTLPAFASTAAKSFTVYGKVPAGQVGVAAGTFTDLVTATVNF